MAKKYSAKEIQRESDLLALRTLEEEEALILSELEQLLLIEEYERAEESFYSYFKSAWSYFDPEPFKDNWHIECIAEHCQAAYNRQVRRLLITIPPRCQVEGTRVLLSNNTYKSIENVQINDEVITFNESSEQLESNKVINTIHSGQKECLSIKLSNGQFIKCSKDHEIYTVNRGFIRATEINIHDVVITPRYYKNTNIDLISLDDTFLIALWCAEGFKTLRSGYGFANTDPIIINKAKTIAESKGWQYRQDSYCGHRLINNKSTGNKPGEINQWLSTYFPVNTTTYNIRVPSVIFQSSNAIKIEFLNTFIACDGWIDTNSGKIGTELASEELAKDIFFLFKQLGFTPTLKQRKPRTIQILNNKKLTTSKTHYSVTISKNEEIEKAKSIFNFYHKQKKLESIKLKTTHKSLREIPSCIIDLNYINSKLKYQIKTRRFFNESKIINNYNNLDLINKLKNRQINYLEVIQIENIGLQNCYDLSIENNENYFAEDILVHNCSKSSIVSIGFPTWVWTQNPAEKFVTASYSEKLATQFAVNSRQLINHPWYKSRWVGPDKKFTMRKDSNTKTRIDNDKYGYRISTSPGGIGTGVGYTIAIIDDLLNAKESTSKAKKEENVTWYKGTLKNRANDPKTDVIIVIAQRLAEDDLPGYLLENEGEEWFHLNIPMEFESKYTFFSSIGYNDPRKEENEVLDPNRFDAAFLTTQKKDPFKYATLYQQRPAPAEGGIIKRNWLEWYSPQYQKQYDYMLLSADLSMTDSDSSDYSVFTVWGRSGTNLYLVDMIRDKMDILSQMDAIRKLMFRYPEIRAKLVENKANGPAVIKMLQKEFNGIIPIEPKDFGGNKEARLAACVAEFASHSIYFPNANECPWILTVMEELFTFPRSKHDDIVDSLTQAINWLSLNQRVLYSPINIEQTNPYTPDNQTDRSITDQTDPTTIKNINQIWSMGSVSTMTASSMNRKSLKSIWD